MLQSQDNRLIAIQTTLGKDVVIALSMSGEEGMSQLFHFDLELLSEKLTIDPKAMLGSNVTFSVTTKDAEPAYFNGVVQRFVSGARVGRDRRQYRMRLVPWLWFLTRRSDLRIFQEMSALEIVQKVLRDTGVTDFKLEAVKTYPKYDYKVQYRETDFDFISRLLEHEGIAYFFRHENGKHTLVIADSTTAIKPCAEAEPFFTIERAWQHVHEWQRGWEYRSGKWTLNDFNFEKPALDLTSSTSTLLDAKSMKDLEMYDYPGSYREKADGTSLARSRIESEEAGYQVVTGAGMVPSFHPGSSFKLQRSEFPSDDGSKMALIWVGHDASDLTDGTSSSGSVDYVNSFRAMPADTPFRPERTTRKPVVPGAQTAIVVGPAGEEIYTDKYGRVKVQFHWDREGKYDEKSSCWLRVAQSWSGKQWGGQIIPRVGMEVIVTFLEGDPDQPIITGMLHNAEAMPPDALPDNKTRTVFRTRSTPKGDGYNEFSFEDKKGDEQVFLRAEKDYELRVKNDAHQTVENDWHQIVKGNALEAIGGDHSITVSGDRKEKIEGTLSLDIGTDQHLKAGQKLAVKAGMEIMIEAGMTLTLKAGANFIKLDPSGVTITGSPFVQINSGGSAGTLSADPKPPAAAKEADDRTPGQALGKLSPKSRTPTPIAPQQSPLQVVQAAALMDAAQAGTPFCPLCAAAGAL